MGEGSCSALEKINAANVSKKVIFCVWHAWSRPDHTESENNSVLIVRFKER